MVAQYIATKVVRICMLILELEVILSIQLPIKIHHDCDNMVQWDMILSMELFKGRNTLNIDFTR